MISEVIVPDLGATGGDVRLDEWLVHPGEHVTAGQPLFVVTTDKATVEVEAFRVGIVRAIHVEAGQAVPLGAVVALLADSMEEPIGEPAAGPGTETPGAAKADQPLQALDRSSNDRILVSPVARQIAAEESLDLSKLRGSGRQGQILKRDVMQALYARKETGVRREPLSPMRRAIAERAQRSKSQAPHFYATITVDMAAALDLHRQVVDWAEKHGWVKPSITDLCIRAAALTLRTLPALNASFAGDAILTYQDINIGLIVGLDEGMLVPVVHNADRLNLYTLAAKTRQLRQRAESGQLAANDLTGGTFTLSNLGMFGVDSFTAVINPPEAGILALAAVKAQPAVIDGVVVPRPLMTAVLSVDHRVADGILAACFVKTFKDMLENPVRLTLEAPPEAPS
jgi:pyruvate dehydrogenase E2 component (dihydrolipoamide acetyltransferase)